MQHVLSTLPYDTDTVHKPPATTTARTQCEVNYAFKKLSVVSKIAEKVVAARFSNHPSDNGLYEKMQSANRPHHSTETALVRVCNDLLCSQFSHASKTVSEIVELPLNGSNPTWNVMALDT